MMPKREPCTNATKSSSRRVRDTVVEWALRLDEIGIKGEGLTFSNSDREKASTVTFNIGRMDGSQIQHGTFDSTQVMNLDAKQAVRIADAILEALPQLGMSAARQSEMEEVIASLKQEIGSDGPDEGKVRSLMDSAKVILQNCAGSALAQMLVASIEKWS